MNATRTDLPRFVLDLLAACPRAGEGVHAWLFSIARQLHAHRTRDEIISLLTATVASCGRTVPAKEIINAVDKAKACAWQPGTRQSGIVTPPRAWPEVNQAARREIVKDGGGLADLWEISPCRIEDNEQHTEEIIDRLFPDNPLLCCGAASYSFDTKPREEWRGELSTLQLIVPSPMTSAEGVTQNGKPSRHTLSNTGPRRFLVTEFDTGTTDEHAAILLHLATCKWRLKSAAGVMCVTRRFKSAASSITMKHVSQYERLDRDS